MDPLSEHPKLMKGFAISRDHMEGYPTLAAWDLWPDKAEVLVQK